MKLRRFIPVLIVAAGIAAYHNSFQGKFIFDDLAGILDNPTIHHLWPIWDALSPPASSMVGGHPVVNFTLAFNYALGGLAVRGYHALNLAIHVLAALTLFGIVRRTLLRPVLWARFGAAGEWIAMAVAVLWMVHPLQTEAVTYISQRGELLMGLFYLLTLYGFIRGVESTGWPCGSAVLRTLYGFIRGVEGSGSAGASPSKWFCLSLAACTLGMATKEVMVTAPLMVLLYDRTFVSGSLREAWARHWRLYLGLACTWLLLGCLMAGSRNLLGRGVGYGLGTTWWGYALTECRVLVRYLRLALWPHPLVFDYGGAIGGGIAISHFAEAAPYALILAVLIGGVLFELRRQPAIGFLGAWFFVILAPSSSVVPVAGQPMAEHRMYLPLAAVVTMAVVGAFEIGKQLFRKRQGVVLGCVTGGTMAVLFSFLTIQRNRDYNSALSIWQDTIDKWPENFRAYYNLGDILLRDGKIREAAAQFEEALRIEPDDAESHIDLGVVLMALGKSDDAVRHYNEALRIDPHHAQAHNDLGVALAQEDQFEESIRQFMVALQIDPGYAEAHNNLGLTLVRMERPLEAIPHFTEAVRINPDYAEAHYGLGLALAQLGRVREAAKEYVQALKLRPDLAAAKDALSRLQAGYTKIP